MTKGQKSQSGAIRFGPALNALFLCSAIGGSAVGYVWQKSRVYELGQQIRQSEIRLGQLKSENQKLDDQLAILRSPLALEERARQMNLGLAPAGPSQVRVLPEPDLAASGNRAARRFADRQVSEMQ